jgi:hypothetical protein
VGCHGSAFCRQIYREIRVFVNEQEKRSAIVI